MRLTDLFEAPIGNWTVDPHFGQNMSKAREQWTGYVNDQDHWSKKEANLLASENPLLIKRVRHGFRNSKFTFNLVFFASDDRNYDRTTNLSGKQVTPEKLANAIGEDATNRVLAQVTPDAITVLLTNNLSDEDDKISITSPWIIAHRIAHSMNVMAVDALYSELCEKLTPLMFGHKWPSHDGPNYRMRDDYFTTYGKMFGHWIGTMRSAREGRLRNVYEFVHELMAQYILTNKIALDLRIPDAVEHEQLTTDPSKIAEAKRLLEQFEKDAVSYLDEVLSRYVGKITVV